MKDSVHKQTFIHSSRQSPYSAKIIIINLSERDSESEAIL